MLKKQCVTFALVCIVLLAPRKSETGATKESEESGDSPDEKYIVLAESTMTNPHEWLHWRKRCFLPRGSEISLSFPCSVSLFLFVPFFFSPKATWTVEVCACYKLENPTVNLYVLKPASAFSMNLHRSETAS